MADSESAHPDAPPEKGSVKKGSDRLRLASPLASAGLGLSLLLAFVHYRTHMAPAEDAFCSLGQRFDCAAVAASPSAIFLGVPWAHWGVLGFVALLLASLSRSIWLLPLSTLAALVSACLLGVSLVHVGSLCYLCEGAHLCSWALCAVAWRGRMALQGDLKDTSGALSVLAAPAGFSLALLLFLPPYWGAFSYKAEPPFPTGVTEEGHAWIGSEDPTLTIHEFTDYVCPHCKAASARTLRRLAKNPTWRLVRRQQPRMKCPTGRASACAPVRMAYCAQAQGKFWRADRWLFVNADPRKKLDEKSFLADLQLNEAEFRACMNEDATYERADAEAKFARKSKIKDVPGYLIDGKRYKEPELKEFLKSH